MKKVILSMAIALVMIVSGYSQDSKNETPKDAVQTTAEKISFGVRGNCGMCKTTIEKAVSSLKGVSDATWDKENKKVTISYDASKTNLMEMHTAIATSGYDTDLSIANQKAYDDLAACCQYDRKMKMNISTQKKEDHSGHKH